MQRIISIHCPITWLEVKLKDVMANTHYVLTDLQETDNPKTLDHISFGFGMDWLQTQKYNAYNSDIQFTSVIIFPEIFQDYQDIYYKCYIPKDLVNLDDFAFQTNKVKDLRTTYGAYLINIHASDTIEDIVRYIDDLVRYTNFTKGEFKYLASNTTLSFKYPSYLPTRSDVECMCKYMNKKKVIYVNCDNVIFKGVQYGLSGSPRITFDTTIKNIKNLMEKIGWEFVFFTTSPEFATPIKKFLESIGNDLLVETVDFMRANIKQSINNNPRFSTFYIGASLCDIDISTFHVACPSDTPEFVKKLIAPGYVSTKNGGEGAFADIMHHLLSVGVGV